MWAAAAHHEDKGFLITGGVGIGWNHLSSTEITKDGVTFEDFTPLPIALNEHCMVALNDEDAGDFFVASGAEPVAGTSKRAFIHKGNQRNEMTEMANDRIGKKPTLEIENG